jgi:hypothetical protein
VETQWTQPFRWGVLMAFDAEAPWTLPDWFSGRGGGALNQPVASTTCLAVPVLSSQDIEVPDDYPEDEPLPEAQVEVLVTIVSSPQGCPHEFLIGCPSGRLNLGDAEVERVLDVHAGTLRIGVWSDEPQFAQRVLLEVSAA